MVYVCMLYLCTMFEGNTRGVYVRSVYRLVCIFMQCYDVGVLPSCLMFVVCVLVCVCIYYPCLRGPHVSHGVCNVCVVWCRYVRSV